MAFVKGFVPNCETADPTRPQGGCRRRVGDRSVLPYAQEDRRFLPLLICVELGDLLLGRSKACGETFHFAEPALPFSLRDTVGKVVADLDEPWPLDGGNDEDGTTDAGFSELPGRPVIR